MKISWHWLGHYVDLSGVDGRSIAEQFTLSVAELEGVEVLGQGMEGVVAARVVEVAPHPASETLRVARIATGTAGEHTVVCGAPNVRAGLVSVWAPPGTRLANGNVLERAAVRGVESEGMLVAEDELGISEDHTRVIELPAATAPGWPISEIAPVADVLWEIDNKSITHRPDLWGHYGIAREVAALLGRALKPLRPEIVFPADDCLRVVVEDPDLCPRYTAYQISGVRIEESPLWLKTLLHRVGMRPINNIVDVSNYVMLATGEPIHAFDARFLVGRSIVVRRSRAGETIVTLDGTARPVGPEDLLIADAEKAVALAGVMGGANSEIRRDTTDVVLEAATFRAAAVRRASARARIRTEASLRFEKSLDPEAAVDASHLFARLVLDLCPTALVSSRFYDVRAPASPPPPIELSLDLLNRRLGKEIAPAFAIGVLTRLGFTVRHGERAGRLTIGVPSWRATKDVSIPEDIIEEIGRIHGWGNIPPAAPFVTVKPPVRLPSKQQERDVRSHLALACGFHEVATYAFEQKRVLAAFGLPADERVAVRNPISEELPALKTDLAPGLLTLIERNIRQFRRFKIFEIARVFRPGPAGEIPVQRRRLAGLIAEATKREDPKGRLFYEAKGAAESLLSLLGLEEATLAPVDRPDPWVHPARSTAVVAGGSHLGLVAQAHPLALSALGLEAQAAFFEIDLDTLLGLPRASLKAKPLPKFPASEKDLSVLVPKAVRVADLARAIRETDPALIRSVVCFSVFTDPPIPEGQKSVSFAVRFQSDDRTLEDEEVKRAMQAITDRLASFFGATFRGGDKPVSPGGRLFNL